MIVSGALAAPQLDQSVDRQGKHDQGAGGKCAPHGINAKHAHGAEDKLEDQHADRAFS